MQTTNEILARLDDLLDLHFPDEQLPSGPYWRQDPYRCDLFDLSIHAYGIVHYEDVQEHIHQRMDSRKHQAPSDVERQLDELVDAWNHWQFAYQRLAAK